MLSLEFSRWNIEYSSIASFNTWVKNVYRRFINWFINSVSLSPLRSLINVSVQINKVQVRLIHQTVNQLNTYLSTVKNNTLYPLFSTYTHNPQHLLLRPIKRI